MDKGLLFHNLSRIVLYFRHNSPKSFYSYSLLVNILHTTLSRDTLSDSYQFLAISSLKTNKLDQLKLPQVFS